MPCSSQIVREMLPEIHTMEKCDFLKPIINSFSNNLTLKAPSKIAADDIVFFFFLLLPLEENKASFFHVNSLPSRGFT